MAEIPPTCDALLVIEEAPSNPEFVGARFELSAAKAAEGNGYCIGRVADAEIRLSSRYVARSGARVRREDGAWYLHDTMASVPPTVEGVTVQTYGRLPLTDGNRFTVGDVVVFRFTLTSPG